MNAINRLLLLLLSLATIAFGSIALLVMSKWVTPEAVSPGGVLLGQWRFFAGLQGDDLIAAAIVCGVLLAVGVLLLVLELLTLRRSRKAEAGEYVVRQDGLGRVTVARKSVRDLVQYEAASIPGVVEVNPQVRDGSNGMVVYTRASLAPDADAINVAEQLQQKIQTSVQSHLGLSVAEVQVATQVAPVNGGEQRRVR